MSSTPGEFLALAEALLKIDSPSSLEIRSRAAVSRAYYAAYHRAQALASSLDAPTSRSRNAGSHEQLMDRLEQAAETLRPESRKTLEAGIENLRRLKVWRVDADYRIEVDHDARRGPQAVDFARRLIGKLERCAAG